MSQLELDFPRLSPSFDTSSCLGIWIESGTHNTVTNSSILSRNLFWKKSYQQHLLNLYWKWPLLWIQNKPLHHLKLSQPPQCFSANQMTKKKCGMWKRTMTNSFHVLITLHEEKTWLTITYILQSLHMKVIYYRKQDNSTVNNSDFCSNYPSIVAQLNQESIKQSTNSSSPE